MNTQGHIWTVIAVALSIGCSSDESADPEPELSADAEACEHLEQGPPVAVTASVAADDGAPAVAADHKRYDIMLAETSGTYGGFAAFAAAEQADYLFFLDRDVPVAFEDSSLMTIATEASTQSSPDCALVKGRHLVPLEVGTIYLAFGPTPEPLVGLVIEEAAHEEHE